MSDLSGRTTVVVGASRGLGRGIAGAFAEAVAPVVAVARTGPALAELAATSANIRTEVADAADATAERITFHDLRHTCASLLFQKNVHPKFVQELLGHASVAITLDTYSHMLPGMGSEAADAMSEALG
ncbi:MAG TPA: tyrosine-type recombinase/integrase [Rubrobacteraceae bacterium]|nr:tyrosine-type recombinase/integrase [Rubrobacteraceae bacterium]